MPPKPTELMRGAGAEFYNIDFSLQNQLRLAGASVPPDLQDQVMMNRDIFVFQRAFSSYIFDKIANSYLLLNVECLEIVK